MITTCGTPGVNPGLTWRVEMSKGSKPRPFSVTQQEYDTRWDAIFQRDIKEIEDAKNEEDEFKFLETHRKINELNKTKHTVE